jgi:carboxymethylenebutenolidase
MVPDRRGAVVVIHHLPGWDRATKEITRRLAVMGYDAYCPNLYSREAPGLTPEEASALVRANGGVDDTQIVADAAAVVSYARAASTANGRVGVIGFCSGGRHSVLVACSVDVDAAVDCYGSYVTGSPPPDFPLRITNIEAQLPDLRCPLLGVFGDQDTAPSPAEVNELERVLSTHSKHYEFHRYPHAGHGFLAVDRPTYRVEPALDAWSRIGEFFDRRLSEPSHT